MDVLNCKRKLITVTVILLGIVLLLFPLGCSDSGSSNNLPVSVPVQQLVGTVTINQDTTTTFEFTPDLSQTAGPFSGITFDLASTIKTIQVNSPGAFLDFFIKSAFATHVAEGEVLITAFIGFESEIDVVCSEGEQYGPFTVSVDNANQLIQVDPPTATASTSAVQIINSGSMAICIKVESNVPASVNVEQLDFVVEDCNEPATIVAGAWEGEFFCENIGCPDDPLQSISIVIVQNGDRAMYNDGDGDFTGTVCGDVFSFSRSALGIHEDESGTFTLNADKITAIKKSKWTDQSGFCRGTCTDTYSKVQ